MRRSALPALRKIKGSLRPGTSLGAPPLDPGGGGPAYGVATGVLFAAGGVSTKAAVGGAAASAFMAALVLCILPVSAV
jgi:hypothetical protein